MKPVVLIMLGAGTWLLYSAIANKQPLGVLANAVGYTSTNPTVTGTQDTSANPATPTTPTSAASNSAPLGVDPAQWAILNNGLAGNNIPGSDLPKSTVVLQD